MSIDPMNAHYWGGVITPACGPLTVEVAKGSPCLGQGDPPEVTLKMATESAKEWMQKYIDERSAHEQLKDAHARRTEDLRRLGDRVLRYERWIDRLLDRE